MKNKTQVFKTYSDFLGRENKSINGVSEKFARDNPNYAEDNETNLGCWDCYECSSCSYCRDCRSCYECRSCRDCRDCYDCRYCRNCSDCDDCRSCEYCRSCRSCYECRSCRDCRDCRYCYDCRECRSCSSCRECSSCYECRSCRDCRYCRYCRVCRDCRECQECRSCYEIEKGDSYTCITSAYKYTCCPRIKETGEQLIQMGCHLRTREEWEGDFWNNDNEFPNDGSEESNNRLIAFKLACAWLDLKTEGK